MPKSARLKKKVSSKRTRKSKISRNKSKVGKKNKSKVIRKKVIRKKVSTKHKNKKMTMKGGNDTISKLITKLEEECENRIFPDYTRNKQFKKNLPIIKIKKTEINTILNNLDNLEIVIDLIKYLAEKYIFEYIDEISVMDIKKEFKENLENYINKIYKYIYEELIFSYPTVYMHEGYFQYFCLLETIKLLKEKMFFFYLIELNDKAVYLGNLKNIFFKETELLTECLKYLKYSKDHDKTVNEHTIQMLTDLILLIFRDEYVTNVILEPRGTSLVEVRGLKNLNYKEYNGIIGTVSYKYEDPKKEKTFYKVTSKKETLDFPLEKIRVIAFYKEEIQYFKDLMTIFLDNQYIYIYKSSTIQSHILNLLFKDLNQQDKIKKFFKRELCISNFRKIYKNPEFKSTFNKYFTIKNFNLDTIKKKEPIIN